MEGSDKINNGDTLNVESNGSSGAIKNCTLCGCSTPAVRCDKCGSQVFCLSCDDMYHRHPKRRLHLRKAVDSIWNSHRSPRLRRRTELPGDPSKIPIPPPRSKKRHTTSSGFSSPFDMQMFGYKMPWAQKRSPDLQRDIRNRSPIFIEANAENANVENDFNNANGTEANTLEVRHRRSSADNPNSPPISSSSPIHVTVPETSPVQMRTADGMTLGYPQQVTSHSMHHSMSASDLSGVSSSARPMPPFYHFPHVHGFVHPHMPPYHPSMGQYGCPQCVSASWSNLMSPSMAHFHQHAHQWPAPQSPLSKSSHSPESEGVSRLNQSPMSGPLHFPGSYTMLPPGAYAYNAEAMSPLQTFSPEQEMLRNIQRQDLSPTSSQPESRQSVGPSDESHASLPQLPSMSADAESVANGEEEEEEVEEVAEDDTEFVIPEKPTVPWECTHCTYVNPPGSHICEICCKTSYQVPTKKKPKKKVAIVAEAPVAELPAPDVDEVVPMDIHEAVYVGHREDKSIGQVDDYEVMAREESEVQEPETLDFSDVDSSEIKMDDVESSPVETAETQTVPSTMTTDIQTQMVDETTATSFTEEEEDIPIEKREMSIQTELEESAHKRSIATDPMISSHSMESLLSGVSAPPYHNRRAGNSFSTQSLSAFERGRSRSPMPRSSSMMGEMRSIGRGVPVVFQDPVGSNWTHSWLSSDPMYYKPHALAPSPSRDEYYDGNWGSMDRLNKGTKKTEEEKWKQLPGKPRYHKSLENLKIEKVPEPPFIRCLKKVKDAERCGYSVEDLQVAYFNCRNDDPLFWLQENWDTLVKNVTSLAAKCAEDNEEHDVGAITTAEARYALHKYRGNIWEAVTECIELRQRKILELTIRGNFTQKQIVEALKNNDGNVELAYADLIRATTKLFKHILSPGLSEESEDININVHPVKEVSDGGRQAHILVQQNSEEEISSEKKRSDFLDKLAAVREAQTERRKAREEKEFGRDTDKTSKEEEEMQESSHVLTDTAPEIVSEKVMEDALEDGLSKSVDMQQSAAFENSQFEVIHSDVEQSPTEEFTPDVNVIESKKVDELPEDFDGHWVDSQGEWIEEFSDEQWEEEGEGEGEWVTVRTRYKKLDDELDAEALEMAALWEKEELADDVFEDEPQQQELSPEKDWELKDALQNEPESPWSGMELPPANLSAQMLMQQELLDEDFEMDANDNWIVQDAKKLLQSPENETCTNDDEKLTAAIVSDNEAKMPSVNEDEDVVVMKLDGISRELERDSSKSVEREERGLSDSLEGSLGEDWEKVETQKSLDSREFTKENDPPCPTIEELTSPESDSKQKVDEIAYQDAQNIEDVPLPPKRKSSIRDVDMNNIQSQKLASADVTPIPIESVETVPKPPIRRKSKLSDVDIKEVVMEKDGMEISSNPNPIKHSNPNPNPIKHSNPNPNPIKHSNPNPNPNPLCLDISSCLRTESLEEMDRHVEELEAEYESRNISPGTSFSYESDSNCFADSESEEELRARKLKKHHHRSEIDDPEKLLLEEERLIDEDLKKLKAGVEASKASFARKPQHVYDEEEPMYRPFSGPLVRMSSSSFDEGLSPKAYREDLGRPLQLFTETPQTVCSKDNVSVDESIFHSASDALLFEEIANKQDFSQYETPTQEPELILKHVETSSVATEVPYVSPIAESLITDPILASKPEATVFPELQSTQLQMEDVSLDHPTEGMEPPTEIVRQESIYEMPALSEMEATSAVADYFFGRYNEITVVKKGKKKPVPVKATSAMKPMSMSVAVKKDVSPSVSAGSATNSTSLSQQGKNIGPGSTEQCPHVPTPVIPPEPAEPLSFADDYFFGSYNAIAAPKPKKKVPVPFFPRSALNESVQASPASSVKKPLVRSSSSQNIAASPGFAVDISIKPKDQETPSYEESYDSEPKSMEDPSSVPDDEVYYMPESGTYEENAQNEDFSDAQAFIQSDLQLAESCAIGTTPDAYTEAISKGKSVTFGGTSEIIAPPPRGKKTKKDEYQSDPQSNIASNVEKPQYQGPRLSAADEYLFGRYDEIMPQPKKVTPLSKKKLPPSTKDLENKSTCAPCASHLPSTCVKPLTEIAKECLLSSGTDSLLNSETKLQEIDDGSLCFNEKKLSDGGLKTAPILAEEQKLNLEANYHSQITENIDLSQQILQSKEETSHHDIHSDKAVVSTIFDSKQSADGLQTAGQFHSETNLEESHDVKDNSRPLQPEGRSTPTIVSNIDSETSFEIVEMDITSDMDKEISQPKTQYQNDYDETEKKMTIGEEETKSVDIDEELKYSSGISKEADIKTSLESDSAKSISKLSFESKHTEAECEKDASNIQGNLELAAGINEDHYVEKDMDMMIYSAEIHDKDIAKVDFEKDLHEKKSAEEMTESSTKLEINLTETDTRPEINTEEETAPAICIELQASSEYDVDTIIEKSPEGVELVTEKEMHETTHDLNVSHKTLAVETKHDSEDGIDENQLGTEDSTSKGIELDSEDDREMLIESTRDSFESDTALLSEFPEIIDIVESSSGEIVDSESNPSIEDVTDENANIADIDTYYSGMEYSNEDIQQLDADIENFDAGVVDTSLSCSYLDESLSVIEEGDFEDILNRSYDQGGTEEEREFIEEEEDKYWGKRDQDEGEDQYEAKDQDEEQEDQDQEQEEDQDEEQEEDQDEEEEEEEDDEECSECTTISIKPSKVGVVDLGTTDNDTDASEDKQSLKNEDIEKGMPCIPLDGSHEHGSILPDEYHAAKVTASEISSETHLETDSNLPKIENLSNLETADRSEHVSEKSANELEGISGELLEVNANEAAELGESVEYDDSYSSVISRFYEEFIESAHPCLPTVIEDKHLSKYSTVAFDNSCEISQKDDSLKSSEGSNEDSFDSIEESEIDSHVCMDPFQTFDDLKEIEEDAFVSVGKILTVSEGVNDLNLALPLASLPNTDNQQAQLFVIDSNQPIIHSEIHQTEFSANDFKLVEKVGITSDNVTITGPYTAQKILVTTVDQSCQTEDLDFYEDEEFYDTLGEDLLQELTEERPDSRCVLMETGIQCQIINAFGMHRVSIDATARHLEASTHANISGVILPSPSGVEQLKNAGASVEDQTFYPISKRDSEEISMQESNSFESLGDDDSDIFMEIAHSDSDDSNMPLIRDQMRLMDIDSGTGSISGSDTGDNFRVVDTGETFLNVNSEYSLIMEKDLHSNVTAAAESCMHTVSTAISANDSSYDAVCTEDSSREPLLTSDSTNVAQIVKIKPGDIHSSSLLTSPESGLKTEILQKSEILFLPKESGVENGQFLEKGHTVGDKIGCNEATLHLGDEEESFQSLDKSEIDELSVSESFANDFDEKQIGDISVTKTQFQKENANYVVIEPCESLIGDEEESFQSLDKSEKDELSVNESFADDLDKNLLGDIPVSRGQSQKEKENSIVVESSESHMTLVEKSIVDMSSNISPSTAQEIEPCISESHIHSVNVESFMIAEECIVELSEPKVLTYVMQISPSQPILRIPSITDVKFIEIQHPKIDDIEQGLPLEDTEERVSSPTVEYFLPCSTPSDFIMVDDDSHNEDAGDRFESLLDNISMASESQNVSVDKDVSLYSEELWEEAHSSVHETISDECFTDVGSAFSTTPSELELYNDKSSTSITFDSERCSTASSSVDDFELPYLDNSSVSIDALAFHEDKLQLEAYQCMPAVIDAIGDSQLRLSEHQPSSGVISESDTVVRSKEIVCKSSTESHSEKNVIKSIFSQIETKVDDTFAHAVPDNIGNEKELAAVHSYSQNVKDGFSQLPNDKSKETSILSELNDGQPNMQRGTTVESSATSLSHTVTKYEQTELDSEIVDVSFHSAADVSEKDSDLSCDEFEELHSRDESIEIGHSILKGKAPSAIVSYLYYDDGIDFDESQQSAGSSSEIFESDQKNTETSNIFDESSSSSVNKFDISSSAAVPCQESKIIASETYSLSSLPSPDILCASETIHDVISDHQDENGNLLTTKQESVVKDFHPFVSSEDTQVAYQYVPFVEANLSSESTTVKTLEISPVVTDKTSPLPLTEETTKSCLPLFKTDDYQIAAVIPRDIISTLEEQRLICSDSFRESEGVQEDFTKKANVEENTMTESRVATDAPISENEEFVEVPSQHLTTDGSDAFQELETDPSIDDFVDEDDLLTQNSEDSKDVFDFDDIGISNDGIVLESTSPQTFELVTGTSQTSELVTETYLEILEGRVIETTLKPMSLRVSEISLESGSLAIMHSEIESTNNSNDIQLEIQAMSKPETRNKQMEIERPDTELSGEDEFIDVDSFIASQISESEEHTDSTADGINLFPAVESEGHIEREHKKITADNLNIESISLNVYERIEAADERMSSQTDVDAAKSGDEMQPEDRIQLCTTFDKKMEEEKHIDLDDDFTDVDSFIASEISISVSEECVHADHLVADDVNVLHSMKMHETANEFESANQKSGIDQMIPQKQEQASVDTCESISTSNVPPDLKRDIISLDKVHETQLECAIIPLTPVCDIQTEEKHDADLSTEDEFTDINSYIPSELSVSEELEHSDQSFAAADANSSLIVATEVINNIVDNMAYVKVDVHSSNIESVLIVDEPKSAQLGSTSELGIESAPEYSSGKDTTTNLSSKAFPTGTQVLKESEVDKTYDMIQSKNETEPPGTFSSEDITDVSYHSTVDNTDKLCSKSSDVPFNDAKNVLLNAALESKVVVPDECSIETIKLPEGKLSVQTSFYDSSSPVIDEKSEEEIPESVIKLEKPCVIDNTQYIQYAETSQKPVETAILISSDPSTKICSNTSKTSETGSDLDEDEFVDAPLDLTDETDEWKDVEWTMSAANDGIVPVPSTEILLRRSHVQKQISTSSTGEMPEMDEHSSFHDTICDANLKRLSTADSEACFAEECELATDPEEVMVLHLKPVLHEPKQACVFDVSELQESDQKFRQSPTTKSSEELTKSSADKADTIADFSELSEISDFPTDSTGGKNIATITESYTSHFGPTKETVSTEDFFTDLSAPYLTNEEFEEWENVKTDYCLGELEEENHALDLIAQHSFSYEEMKCITSGVLPDKPMSLSSTDIDVPVKLEHKQISETPDKHSDSLSKAVDPDIEHFSEMMSSTSDTTHYSTANLHSISDSFTEKSFESVQIDETFPPPQLNEIFPLTLPKAAEMAENDETYEFKIREFNSYGQVPLKSETDAGSSIRGIEDDLYLSPDQLEESNVLIPKVLRDYLNDINSTTLYAASEDAVISPLISHLEAEGELKPAKRRAQSFPDTTVTDISLSLNNEDFTDVSSNIIKTQESEQWSDADENDFVEDLEMDDIEVREVVNREVQVITDGEIKILSSKRDGEVLVHANQQQLPFEDSSKVKELNSETSIVCDITSHETISSVIIPHEHSEISSEKDKSNSVAVLDTIVRRDNENLSVESTLNLTASLDISPQSPVEEKSVEQDELINIPSTTTTDMAGHDGDILMITPNDLKENITEKAHISLSEESDTQKGLKQIPTILSKEGMIEEVVALDLAVMKELIPVTDESAVTSQVTVSSTDGGIESSCVMESSQSKSEAFYDISSQDILTEELDNEIFESDVEDFRDDEISLKQAIADAKVPVSTSFYGAFAADEQQALAAVNIQLQASADTAQDSSKTLVVTKKDASFTCAESTTEQLHGSISIPSQQSGDEIITTVTESGEFSCRNVEIQDMVASTDEISKQDIASLLPHLPEHSELDSHAQEGDAIEDMSMPPSHEISRALEVSLQSTPVAEERVQSSESSLMLQEYDYNSTYLHEDLAGEESSREITDDFYESREPYMTENDLEESDIYESWSDRSFELDENILQYEHENDDHFIGDQLSFDIGAIEDEEEEEILRAVDENLRKFNDCMILDDFSPSPDEFSPSPDDGQTDVNIPSLDIEGYEATTEFDDYTQNEGNEGESESFVSISNENAQSTNLFLLEDEKASYGDITVLPNIQEEQHALDSQSTFDNQDEQNAKEGLQQSFVLPADDIFVAVPVNVIENILEGDNIRSEQVVYEKEILDTSEKIFIGSQKSENLTESFELTPKDTTVLSYSTELAASTESERNNSSEKVLIHTEVSEDAKVVTCLTSKADITKSSAGENEQISLPFHASKSKIDVIELVEKSSEATMKIRHLDEDDVHSNFNIPHDGLKMSFDPSITETTMEITQGDSHRQDTELIELDESCNLQFFSLGDISKSSMTAKISDAKVENIAELSTEQKHLVVQEKEAFEEKSVDQPQHDVKQNKTQFSSVSSETLDSNVNIPHDGLKMSFDPSITETIMEITQGDSHRQVTELIELDESCNLRFFSLGDISKSSMTAKISDVKVENIAELSTEQKHAVQEKEAFEEKSADQPQHDVKQNKTQFSSVPSEALGDHELSESLVSNKDEEEQKGKDFASSIAEIKLKTIQSEFSEQSTESAESEQNACLKISSSEKMVVTSELTEVIHSETAIEESKTSVHENIPDIDMKTCKESEQNLTEDAATVLSRKKLASENKIAPTRCEQQILTGGVQPKEDDVTELGMRGEEVNTVKSEFGEQLITFTQSEEHYEITTVHELKKEPTVSTSTESGTSTRIQNEKCIEEDKKEESRTQESECTREIQSGKLVVGQVMEICETDSSLCLSGETTVIRDANKGEKPSELVVQKETNVQKDSFSESQEQDTETKLGMTIIETEIIQSEFREGPIKQTLEHDKVKSILQGEKEQAVSTAIESSIEEKCVEVAKMEESGSEEKEYAKKIQSVRLSTDDQLGQTTEAEATLQPKVEPIVTADTKEEDEKPPELPRKRPNIQRRSFSESQERDVETPPCLPRKMSRHRLSSSDEQKSDVTSTQSQMEHQLAAVSDAPTVTRRRTSSFAKVDESEISSSKMIVQSPCDTPVVARRRTSSVNAEECAITLSEIGAQPPSDTPVATRRRTSSSSKSDESASTSSERTAQSPSGTPVVARRRTSSSSTKTDESAITSSEMACQPATRRRRSRADETQSSQDAERIDSDSKTIMTRRISYDDERTILSRKNKLRMSVEERMSNLQAEGKCTSREHAFIAAKLIEMQFEEEDALIAARQCNTVYHAVKFLTQLCDLCNCRFPINVMSSMAHCPHKACKECLKAHFTTLIYDRSVFSLLCPVCRKPDISDSNIQDYFNHLDMMLRRILKADVYDLFQSKLRDEVLTKDPNFHWCSQCSNGFLASPRLKKLHCPECSAITCALCHQTWESEHEGVHCERFQQWKDMMTPEPPPAGLVKTLTDRGVTCPSCGINYPHACGGCMSYKCAHCNYKFCGFCQKPYLNGTDCKETPTCKDLGLHAHHPYNCLTFLRDIDSKYLQQLLTESEIPYVTIPAPDQIVKTRCQVREQKHLHGTVTEDRCLRDIVPYFAGLCKVHYMEYLAELIRYKELSPLTVMTTLDLQFMLRKARIFIPEKVKGETLEEYHAQLLKMVMDKLPLL